jgi:hypothetical protein
MGFVRETDARVGISSRRAFAARPLPDRGVAMDLGPPSREPRIHLEDCPMPDLALIILTIVLFGVLALAVRGAERL